MRWSRLGYGLLLASLVLLGGSGCAVVPAYPADLPPLTPAETGYGVVPDISGQYSDRGSGFEPDGTPQPDMSLRELLRVPGPELASDSARADDVVVVAMGNGLLEFQFRRDAALFATLHRHAARVDSGEGGDKSNYTCNKGFVSLVVNADSLGGWPLGLAFHEESLWCRRAADGSLIVLDHQLTGALLVVLPMWRRDDVWYRFPPPVPPSGAGLVPQAP